jgi:hypothetical protein
MSVDDLTPKGTVLVDCSNPGCEWSFWVDATDPRLPDGPFLCPDHNPNSKIDVQCLRCGAFIQIMAVYKEGVIPTVICSDCLTDAFPEYNWDGPYSVEQEEKYTALIRFLTEVVN